MRDEATEIGFMSFAKDVETYDTYVQKNWFKKNSVLGQLVHGCFEAQKNDEPSGAFVKSHLHDSKTGNEKGAEVLNQSLTEIELAAKARPSELYESWVESSPEIGDMKTQSEKAITNSVSKKSISSASVNKPGAGLRILSFFTGCGGLDLGFEQAGFETVYATDIDTASCQTLELNRGSYFNDHMVVEKADITSLKPETLPTNIDLVIGGPPCQSFSASGRRAGGAAGRLDQRGRLFESYCKIIAHVRPKGFVFENVRGILGTNKGEDWKAIINEFAKLGYTVSYRLLDALDYGAPQQRERMFLVGHQLSEPFYFPEPTYGPDSFEKRPHVNTKQAFSGIVQTEDLEALKMLGGKYSHLLPLVPPGQNYLHFTAQRGYARPIFAYRSRFSDFLYKANPETPTKTIIASPGKYTGPLHWENRYFSLKEYMRLQGFPDDFKFSGKRVDVIRQIGNSVSPHVALQLARAIAVQLFGAKDSVRLLNPDKVLSFDRRKGAKAQTTRALHTAIENHAPSIDAKPFFLPFDYDYSEEVINLDFVSPRVRCKVSAKGVKLRVDADKSGKKFLEMLLILRQSNALESPSLRLSVVGYGGDPSTVQTVWNAVDDWVRRSSDFYSLFELYGHFTEPHPLFSIAKFSAISDHPIALFAEHASNFENCSKYFPKTQLIRLFSPVLKTENFTDIANYLRRYRFDIRSQETNIAINADAYMVAYPFNLPSRRQMNFRLHDRALATKPIQVEAAA